MSLGICTLLPYNCLLNAQPYFEQRLGPVGGWPKGTPARLAQPGCDNFFQHHLAGKFPKCRLHGPVRKTLVEMLSTPFFPGSWGMPSMVWTSHLPAALAERRCYGNILVVEAMELCSLLVLNIRGTSSSDQTYANGVCFMLKVIELILVACVSLLFVIIFLFGHLSSRSFPNPWIHG